MKILKANCPRCQGRGFVIHPYAQKSDEFCQWCGGRGKINPEKMCRCGRPAVRSVDGKEVCLIGTDCSKDIPRNAQTNWWDNWTEEDEDKWKEWNESGHYMM